MSIYPDTTLAALAHPVRLGPRRCLAICRVLRQARLVRATERACNVWCEAEAGPLVDLQ